MLPSDVTAYCLYICRSQCRDIRQLILTAMYDAEHKINNMKHGCLCRWLPSGEVESKTNYKNGEYHGKYKGYSSDGTLRRQVPWVDGKRHGTIKTWHENGSLQSEDDYVDDVNHGMHRYWTKDGVLIFKGTFKDGQHDGRCTNWSSTGTLQSITYYKDGMSYGWWKQHHPDIRLEFEEEWLAYIGR